jgi:aspartyl-tRNA(Asn)/glutamyl-tRNA(Gln) amidotransferase subunit A
MSANPLMLLTAIELLDGYATGDIDPVDALVERIDGLSTVGRDNGVTLAIADGVAVREAALVARMRWRTGTARPLEGVPFGVKDIIATSDMRTTGGASVMGDLVPRSDAPCVARLRADGAIAVAKLATSEFAAGQPQNVTFGRVGNPWDSERWTGGSSTGSGAALAHRLLPLAIGTDTGGSVRLPSAWCGTTGLKATYGRVPRTGVLPLSWTLDHVGPMARTARDCGLMLASMAGFDVGDPNSATARVDQRLRVLPGAGESTSLQGTTIGVVEGWFTELCDHEVSAAWRNGLDVLVDAGATIIEVELPSAHLAFAAGWELLFAEAASLHEAHLDCLSELDPGFVQRMLQGRFLLAVDYLRAMRLRTIVLDEALNALDGVDALCTIGVPGTAPRFDDLRIDVDDVAHPMQKVHSRATMFGNFTGLPALMFPSGFDRKGMPTAMQLIGRPFDEAGIINIASAFQERTDVHCMSPANRPPSVDAEGTIEPPREMA